MLELGMALFRGIGMIAAGQAQKEQKDLEAFEIETEKERARLQAVARHNDRIDEYRSNTILNIAEFSKTGRELNSQTVRAFFEGSQVKGAVAEDIARSELMSFFESSKFSREARVSRQEGRAYQQAGIFNALSVVGEAAAEAGKAGAFSSDPVKRRSYWSLG